jgi:hypothetical protein
VSIKCGIIEGHLRVEADQSFATWKLWRWNDGEWIHFYKVGIALSRDLHEPSGNDAELLEEFTAQTNTEAESTRLEGEQATVWVGNFANDRGWILGGDLFNLHTASGGGHDEHATRGAINERGEIDLADDRGGWRNEHTSYREILNGEGENCGGGCLDLCCARGELDSARFPSSADEDLGLNHDLGHPAGEEAFGDGASARGGSGHVGIGDGETGSR